METMDETTPQTPGRDDAEADDSPLGTLERGLFLLSLFDADHPEWSLKDLRERTGLAKATTRRLMKTLEAWGWVAYEAADHKYHLGASALRIVYLAAAQSELVRIVHPFLTRLAEDTTESCSLSIWTDHGPLIIDTVPTSRHFRPLTFKGMLLEGITSADAQVLIAFGPEEAWDDLLAKPIERRTDNTVVDPEVLRKRWQTVRREGVAYDLGEWNPEAPAVAAPLFDRVGELRGAIHVVPPIERASAPEMQRFAAAVKAAAAEISKHLA